MTDAINFFQSMFMFKSFSSFAPSTKISRAEVELAVSLKNEARTLAAKAAEETRSGRITQELALNNTDKAKVFAEITVWHHAQAAEKYRKAAARFEEAGKIQTAKRKAFNLIANKMARRAAKAEAAVIQMNKFLTK